MASSFGTLPTEIQCSIFRQLDPIDLIAASQTCSTFRRIIRPQRIHFIERLLALECVPEIGGPSYGYAYWSEPPLIERVAPVRPFSSPAWDEMRFACTGCLRLRRHTLFRHQQLYRLAYRKPPAGTPAAEAASSWKPSLRGKKWGGRRRKQTEHDDAERIVRRQFSALLQLHTSHHMSMSWCRLLLQELKECRAPGGFEHMVDTALDEQFHDGWEKKTSERGIASIELYRCGYKRRHRRCIECEFQADQAHNASSIFEGTRQVPVVKVHETYGALQTDRWFPGLLDDINLIDRMRKRATFKRFEHPVIAKGRWLYHTPIFMARCPHCQSWNELRAFRVFPIVRRSEGGILAGERVHFNRLNGDGASNVDPCEFICNRCLAEKEGRVVLSEELAASLRFILEAETLSIQNRLLGSLSAECQSGILREMSKSDDCDLAKSVWWKSFDRDEVHSLMNEVSTRKWRWKHSHWVSNMDEDRQDAFEQQHRSETVDREQGWLWLADRWEEVGDDNMRGPNGRLVQWALGGLET